MCAQHEVITILMADDDAEDCLLTKKAMEKAHLVNRLEFVRDGEELMDYLHRRGQYERLQGEPLPGLILLDLNMPKKDGRQALQEIKSHPVLKEIPVVVLTTSKDEADVHKSYGLGANSFISKPVTLPEMVKIMETLDQYWFKIVKLPHPHEL